MKEQTVVVWAANGEPVNLRPTPGTDKPYIAKVPVGAMVTVYEVGESSDGRRWATVEYGGKRGYMLAEFLPGLQTDSQDDTVVSQVVAQGNGLEEIVLSLVQRMESYESRLSRLEEGLG